MLRGLCEAEALQQRWLDWSNSRNGNGPLLPLDQRSISKLLHGGNMHCPLAAHNCYDNDHVRLFWVDLQQGREELEWDVNSERLSPEGLTSPSQTTSS
jgi:hypothetical protein